MFTCDCGHVVLRIIRARARFFAIKRKSNNSLAGSQLKTSLYFNIVLLRLCPSGGIPSQQQAARGELLPPFSRALERYSKIYQGISSSKLE
jgi:hypothetical protein